MSGNHSIGSVRPHHGPAWQLIDHEPARRHTVPITLLMIVFLLALAATAVTP